MQTLHQELDSSPGHPTPPTHPVLRQLMADPVTAYAEEVRVLRQRVAMLESELAATKASQLGDTSRSSAALTSVDTGTRSPRSAAPASEFTECLTPAVVAVDFAQAAASRADRSNPQSQATETAPVSTPATPAPTERAEPLVATEEVEPAPVEPASTEGFAQAWTAEGDDASFEERIAERAFFQASTVDEESRSWLLAD